MKRRLLATLLALTLTMGMTCTVFADTTIKNDSTSKEASVNVKYTVADTYEVTIPAAVEITDSSYSTTGVVSAANVVIKDNETLKVTLTSSTNNFSLKNGSSAVSYSISAAPTQGSTGETVANVTANTDVLKVTAANSEDTKASGSTTLTFTTNETNVAAATKAGDHTDTLTFTVSVAENNQN